MGNDLIGFFHTGLRSRSQNATVATPYEETAASPYFQEETPTDTNTNSQTGLDETISGIHPRPMKNRARIVNGSVIAGITSLFVAAYSLINFVIVSFATPELIAKIRFIKFGMSVSGSVCMFLNAACIFILCTEMKYAIEHYVKTKEKI